MAIGSKTVQDDGKQSASGARIGPEPTHVPERPHEPGLAGALLSLQRSLGNRSVLQLLTRREGSGSGLATPPAGSEVDAVAPTRRWSPGGRNSEVMGGIIGGVVGAGIGFLVGGPVGALVGGVAGAVIGAAAGRASLTGPITNAAVQAAMRSAWTDSQAADAAARHEEGGYIVRRADGSLGVERWPRGAGASISPPVRDAQGHYHGLEVLGEFHTHPNPPVDEAGRQWVPGPSPGDITGITAEHYPGDSYVISRDSVFRVQRDGSVDTLGGHKDILGD